MLSPLRVGQRRIYRARDRTRLKLILRGRRLGFPLAQIREIIDLYDAPADGEARQLQLLVGRIEARRRELLDKREDIDQTLRELGEVTAGCRARLGELSTAPSDRVPEGESPTKAEGRGR